MRTRAWPCGGMLAFGLLAALAACTEAPLMRVTILYTGFVPGCVVLTVRDASGAAPNSRSITVPEGAGELRVAVWNQGGWSDQLRVVAEAHEVTCSGAVVAVAEHAVTRVRGEPVPVTLELRATDADGDGYVAAPPGPGTGTDCNDANPDVHPGAAEVCDGIDNDCEGGVDEGFGVGALCGGDAGCSSRVQCAPDGGAFCAPGTAWYPDGDMDGWGHTPGAVFSCGRPDSGYVPDGGDCDDGRVDVRPGLTEICDGRDNDCLGAVDDGFGLGGSCAAPFGCPGQVACAPDGGTACRATDAGTGDHPDEDGDGAGAQAEICVPDGGPTVPNADDCDDGDPFTALGFPEICDRRDNDCDGQVDNDGGGGGSVCPPGSSWVGHAAAGAGHHWQSLWSWTDGGVWITGESEKLRLHQPSDPYTAATAWTNYDSDCPNGEYTGVWADPATGEAFVVSPGGFYCSHGLTGGAIDQSAMPVRVPDPWSVVGFRNGSSLELYVAGRDGGTLRWSGDGGAEALQPISGMRLNDIHGSSRGNLFAAGMHTGTPPGDPRIYRFAPGTSSWNSTPLPASLQNTGASVQAVYAVNQRLAYAVTDGGHVLRWDGTGWGLHPSPTGAGLRGVLAFGSSSVFVIDARTAWEWNGVTWTRLMDAGTAALGLVDIHGTNPADVWILQDPQMVYRWPQ